MLIDVSQPSSGADRRAYSQRRGPGDGVREEAGKVHLIPVSPTKKNTFIYVQPWIRYTLRPMKRGDIESQLSITNQWWRAAGATWTESDRDLRRVAEAPFSYQPDPLRDIEPPGLYMLLGPRRVGKSVEIKRKIDALLIAGVDRRRIIHAACDGWRDGDLGLLVSIAEELAPPADGPRYFFLDEVTGVSGDWVSRMKWLRDNTALDDDCVVLSGSNSADLQQATKMLAGRRGTGAPHRTLLPMGFGAFCRATGVELPEIEPIRAPDLLRPQADEAINDLRVYLGDLVTAWERFLQVGGFPRAVSEWVSEREISTDFLLAIWDVIHGDALASEEWGELQSEGLLDLLTRGLTSFFNVERATRELAVHRETITRRLLRLQHGYLVWPCYRMDNDQPNLKAQHKLYFIDPLHARLNRLLRSAERFAPDFTQLTEQQLGMALLAQHEREHPGSFSAFRSVMYQRTPTKKEIDFVGPWLEGLPYEGKYTEGAWLREAQTAAKAYEGRCVLATRNVVERDRDRRAVAAGLLALLLDHGTSAVAAPA